MGVAGEMSAISASGRMIWLTLKSNERPRLPPGWNLAKSSF